MCHDAHFQIDAALGRVALATALKRLLPDCSWSQVKRIIATRHVRVNGVPSSDPTLAMHDGDQIDLSARPWPKPFALSDIRIVHLDPHLLVVDKPPRIIALRNADEMDWPATMKAERPTLDELLVATLGIHPDAPGRPLVRGVHRLDRDTSGLMLFALSNEAQQELTQSFRDHAIERNYLAVVHGHPAAQRIESWFVRDRGDGLRGSTPRGSSDLRAVRAVTHINPLEQIGPYSIVRCRLETGRTHQIRIHLMELGHMVCGDRIYTHRIGEAPRVEEQRAPRQALHSSEIRFEHPISRQTLRFESPLAADLSKWLDALRTARRPRRG